MSSLKRGFIPLLIVSAVLVVLILSGGIASSGDKIKFNHAYHVSEVGVACADCHTGIETAPPGTRVIPNHDVCATCHEQVNEPEHCGACHSNPENAAAVPPRPGRYEGFSHQSHTAAGVACADCHGDIAAGLAQPQVPVMAACQSCHTQRAATLDCAKCHRGETPKPADHLTAVWLDDHGLEALAGASNCTGCHQQSSCDNCHQGHNVFGAKGSPHPPGWLFNHFTDTDFGAECLSCHETRTKCVSCHRAMIPAPHSFGPAFANPETGGEHTEEFRASPQTCLACHDLGKRDPTCARCHSK